MRPMNFLAILAALGARAVARVPLARGVERAFVRYARGLERQAQRRHARSTACWATLAALAPPVLVAAGVFWAARGAASAARPRLERRRALPADGLPPLQPRATPTIATALAGGRPRRRAARARRVARRRDGRAVEPARSRKLAIERGLARLVPAGVRDAVLVRRAAGSGRRRALSRRGAARRRMARRRHAARTRRRSRSARDGSARRRGALLWLLDWIPVRLTALSFAVVGDFEDAVVLLAHAGVDVGDRGRRRASRASCSRAAPARSASRSAARCRALGGEPDVSAGARAGRAGRRRSCCRRGVGLVWRALVLWLLLILLLTLANLAP